MSEKYNIEELIIRFLQQDINEEELRYLESWLEEDAEHKSYFFGLKGISDSSRRSFFSKEEVNEASWQRMLARIEKDNMEISSYDKSHTYNLWLSLIKYVAVVAIAVGVGWGIKKIQGNTYLSNSKEKEVVYNEIHVQKGGRANTLVLSDGTKVILNAATTFRYPTSFGEKNRMVYLEGEAYFEVAKDSAREFWVHAGAMDVKVLGTSFNVKAYERLETVATTLVEGSVEVACAGKSFQIVPGEQFVYDKNNRVMDVRMVDTESYVSWKDGYYKFRQTTLEEIMETLSVWYGLNVFYVNESAKQVEFTGKVRRYEDARMLLDKFEQTGDVVFDIKGNNVFITIKQKKPFAREWNSFLVKARGMVWQS